jgi:hypothetical protein
VPWCGTQGNSNTDDQGRRPTRRQRMKQPQSQHMHKGVDEVSPTPMGERHHSGWWNNYIWPC